MFSLFFTVGDEACHLKLLFFFGFFFASDQGKGVFVWFKHNFYSWNKLLNISCGLAASDWASNATFPLTVSILPLTSPFYSKIAS